jgi:transcriptional regulator CtsR
MKIGEFCMKKMAWVLLVVFVLSGCATQVPIKSVRAPTINTTDIQRLAIRPFENKSGVGGTVGAQLSQHLTDKTSQLIMSFGKFTIVAPTDPNADGVFSGEIRNIESKDSQSQREKKIKDKDGKESIVTEITYRRDVSVTFVYSVISSRTGMPVGTVTKQGSTSDYNTKSPNELRDPLTLAKSVVDSQLRTLQQDIVPTIVSSNRPLMKETSNDKTVKQLMKTAQTLVKQNNYEEAIRQYDEIAREYESTAASSNANLLRQAITSDTAARAKLAELFSDTNGLAEKAAKGAVDVLNSKLPSGANIIIMKESSRQESSRIDYIVDQITKSIIQGGKLKIVDRSNQALINSEQEYQLSGNVSDDSIVSIGHQLGAQYIVICRISGESSLRRLNVKVLSVETAQITDQIDFDI